MGYAPFQLLELTVIGAQDLAPVFKKLKTYAITWINPERKLRTQTDQHGKANPTWNDKFVFRVDDNFLNSDTSAVMIDIYALGWLGLGDTNVGTVRVLISNLIPQEVRGKGRSSQRFVALQIRRRSGRPQGILNMGISLLDNTMRTMPLYIHLTGSSVGLQRTDVKIYKEHANRRGSERKIGGPKEETGVKKIQLRRTNSDRTELSTKEKVNQDSGSSCQAVGSDTGGGGSVVNGGSMVNGSVYNGSVVNDSIINGSELCASDIGPSPSVVAAAVARGLVLRPLPVPRNPGSSILGDWKTEESDVEGLKSKIERWRTEFPPLHTFRNNSNNHNNSMINYMKSKNSNSMIKYMKSKRNSPMLGRSQYDGGNAGLFTCFGKAFGCEFTIVCDAEGNGRGNSRVRRICDSDLSSSTVMPR